MCYSSFIKEHRPKGGTSSIVYILIKDAPTLLVGQGRHFLRNFFL